MAQQTRITLEVAMRVRDVSRPPVVRPDGAEPGPGPEEESSGAESAEAPVTRKTPPTSPRGERRRLRRLRKRGDGP